ncbi:glycosyltransferase 1 domain-containing protein 1 [Trichomycterus rosablanca]|uniref:glycosyltransferase 1 domain-containing protein 1 n=1 Tax=Trichomycterus rosablanca TaxID=2290929 RepID=UPI002F356B60
MRVLLLACLIPKTGNYTTAERIRDHIEDAGHVCILRDSRDFNSASEVALLNQKEPFNAALAIHLFKGGRLLLDVGVPFGVVFGGTDINKDVKDEHKRSMMKDVLQRARFAVAFTKEMKQKAESYLKCDSNKISIQAQGIETRISSDFSWRDFLHSSGVEVDQVDDLHVFLLVCGLRRVKDPLYLLNAFSEWHSQNPLVIFIIIGPKVDPAFSTEVEECVKRTDGVYLAAERNQEELHAVMKKSFALVNSSISEGMSAAILEAMNLGVPVLARDIPGNAAIIQHEHNGLLFSSPEEFVLLSKRLLSDQELQENLRVSGKCYVMEKHNAAQERSMYHKLIETLC